MITAKWLSVGFLLITPIFAQVPARIPRAAAARTLKPEISFAGELAILPHLVDGGQYKSQIVVTNLGKTAEPFEIDFYSSTGQPMNFSIGGLLAPYVSGTLQPNQSVIYKTDGTTGGGPQVDGWGRTNTDNGRTGSDISIYQILNNQVPNQFVAEATTESSYGILGDTTSPGAIINFDNTNGYSCGYAFTNPDISGFSVDNYNILDADVYDSIGTKIGSHRITVQPGHKLLSVIQYDWPETNNNAGSIVLRPDNGYFTPITPLAFRFLILPTGIQSFTTLPVLMLY